MRRLTIGHRPRVVLADDHPLILQAAIAALTPRFDVVAAVGSGEEAVAATAHLAPDVVVLDIAMPGLDGFQTAAAIRARGPRPLIAFMSAHLGDDYILEGLARGGSAFVAKARMGLDLIPALEYAQAGHACVPSARVLPAWRRPVGRCHDLQLYGSDQALIASVVDFFGAALEAGDSVVAMATPAHLDEFAKRLRGRRVNVAALTEGGRYTAVDADAALDAVVVKGTPAEERFIATLDPVVELARCAGGGSRHVSLFGEMAPLLCARKQDSAAFALERMADAYAASRQLSLLCGYPLAALGGTAALSRQICAAHHAIALADAHS
jgi:CheY-like chemotaxis protein